MKAVIEVTRDNANDLLCAALPFNVYMSLDTAMPWPCSDEFSDDWCLHVAEFVLSPMPATITLERGTDAGTYSWEAAKELSGCVRKLCGGE